MKLEELYDILPGDLYDQVSSAIINFFKAKITLALEEKIEGIDIDDFEGKKPTDEQLQAFAAEKVREELTYCWKNSRAEALHSGACFTKYLWKDANGAIDITRPSYLGLVVRKSEKWDVLEDLINGDEDLLMPFVDELYAWAIAETERIAK